MVDLASNFLSSLKAHYNQLSILSGEQNLSEIIVLQCLLLDVSNIACYSGTFFLDQATSVNKRLYLGSIVSIMRMTHQSQEQVS
jgi:hypothetical protein